MSNNNEKFSWTPSQLAAINVTGKRILVSAAAGSGKSTVLTERIISSIIDESKHYDLSKLLIVTFTRDSAEDLKNKITDELSKRVKEDPANKHLYDQLMKLPSAMINTIDGACFSYIKKHFDLLGLPASVSIIDENVADSLRADTMERFIEFCYSGKFEPIPDFDTFSENFVTERDEKLSELFLGLYSKLENLPSGFDDLKDIPPVTSGEEFLSSPFGNLLTSRLQLITDYYVSSLTMAVEYAKQDNPYSRFLPEFSEALSYITKIDNALSNGDFSALVYLTSNPIQKPKGYVQKNRTAEGDLYLLNTKTISTLVSGWYDQIFCFTDEMFAVYSNRLSELTRKIYAFLIEFHKRFSDVKLRRGNIDFDDLKHYAIKLFFNPDGTVSDIAKEISSSLTEIFVDECQDLNPLQNKIFEALSVNCPIFMVGDIKQSIYGFRGADSGVFAQYKRTFPLYSEDKKYDDVTVFLYENFRSTENILNFANVVSDAMFFTPESTRSCFDLRIPYSENDRLCYGSKKETVSPEISLINCIVDNKNKHVSEKNTADLEAEMVANEISKLIKNGVAPEDIAILLRNAKSNAKLYEKKLHDRNIPVYTKKGALLLDTPEVQLALCLLNCCDNPYRDVFLTGALRSPIFAFTLDDLIKIKRFDPTATSLYSALINYTRENNFKKGQVFLEFLGKMRRFSMNNSVDRILWQIYTETSFFSLLYDGTVTDSGALARRSNLIALHDIAKQVSSGGQTGLYTFIEKLRMLIEEEKSPAAAVTEANGVKLMTVHASKGLEFKYCFLSSTSTPFSIHDKRENVVFNSSLGFTAMLKDTNLISKTSTPFRAALLFNTDFEWREEEMRLLYVALTRAKHKLYITSATKDIDKTVKELQILSACKHPYNFMRTSSLIKWILLALNTENKTVPIYTLTKLEQTQILEESRSAAITKADIAKSLQELTDEQNDHIYNELKKRIEFVYPFKASMLLPSKLSVSKLYPEILDEERYYGATNVIKDDGGLYDVFETESKVAVTDNSSLLKVPDFLLGNVSQTGADRGTATHVFMQFCNFELLEKNGVDSEIDRLIKKRFMLPTHASLINKDAIKAFMHSDIYKQISDADEVNREYRFNIKLRASDFTADEAIKEQLKNEQIFVQGIIDCYFKDKSGDIVLLDYKTDYVPDEIRGDENAENKFFISRHARQLGYYAKALKILTGKDVSKTVIYSFNLGRCIEIN